MERRCSEEHFPQGLILPIAKQEAAFGDEDVAGRDFARVWQRHFEAELFAALDDQWLADRNPTRRRHRQQVRAGRECLIEHRRDAEILGRGERLATALLIDISLKLHLCAER